MFPGDGYSRFDKHAIYEWRRKKEMKDHALYGKSDLSYTNKTKKVGYQNKGGYSPSKIRIGGFTITKIVFWGGIIILLVIFYRAVYKFVNTLLGQGMTESEEKALSYGMAEFQRYEHLPEVVSMWGRLPKSKSHYVDIANRCEVMLNSWFVDWTELDTLICQLNADEILAVYIKFGSRVNNAGFNLVGSLPAWILKGAQGSALWSNDAYEDLARQFRRLPDTMLDTRLLPLDWGTAVRS